MKTRSLTSILPVALAAVTLALTAGTAQAKGSKTTSDKPFHKTGVVQSVDTAQNSITLEGKKGATGAAAAPSYTLAPSAVVKSGSETKALSDVSAGTKVRLIGTRGASGSTVTEIDIMPAHKSKGSKA